MRRRGRRARQEYLDSWRGASTYQTTLLRLEGAAVATGAIGLAIVRGESLLWFALLFLAPDLSMLGYFGGRRLGSLTYNAVHTYLAPGALLVAGLYLGVGVAVFGVCSGRPTSGSIGRWATASSTATPPSPRRTSSVSRTATLHGRPARPTRQARQADRQNRRRTHCVVNSNRAPPASLSVRFTSQPWASAISPTMARPSPVLCSAVV